MGLTAKEAAQQVGLTKAGLIKAIRTGKISANKDVHGQWDVDPAELFRVYSPVHNPVDDSPQASTPEDTPSLQVEIRLLRELLAAKDDQIRDLRQRLDAEAEERRRLTALLPAPRPAPWWKRLGR